MGNNRNLPAARPHAKTETNTDITNALVGAMTDEARTILDEGIAKTPDDIDLVIIHGYGFPRWRGGPMFMRGGADRQV